MVDPDFNKHLNDYIVSRRKREGTGRSFFSRKKPVRKVDEEFPNLRENEVRVVGKKKSFYHWITRGFSSGAEKKTSKSPDAVKEMEDEVDFASEEHEIQKEIQRSPSLWKRFSSWFSSEGEVPTMIEMDEHISAQENELKDELEAISKREEELRVQLDEIEHRKRNITDRFINVLNERKIMGADSGRVVSLEDYNRLESDMIEVAKISIEMYKDIPRRKRDVFMESEEFKRFKRILKERNIIRENKA